MQIKCPNCGESITLEQNVYDSIANEIRNEQFEKELEKRATSLIKEKESEIALAVSQAEGRKEKEISELKAKIASVEAKLKTAEVEQAAKLTELATKKDAELSVKLAEAEKTISNLKVKNESLENEKDLAIKNAVQEQVTKVVQLQNQLELVNKEHELQVNTLKTGFETEIKLKDEQIQQIKDFRKKQSTKMIGENLEQHCSISFDRVRPLFPNATFGKDNDASEGSKGDFIYREVTSDGIEVLSIMFEMKNQDEDTKTKHKNEDFFKKLDSDRTKKKCEYAILVSTLEEDNDLYNDGIVDISHVVPKGFVIRPQFFIPIIQILRTSALKTIDAKRELKVMREQERDLTNFEANLEMFKNGLTGSFEKARNNHNKAIKEIKDTIEQLQNVVTILERSNDQMSTCDTKLEDFTVKKITKNAPSVFKKLEDLRSADIS
jgi:hypothetical protein